MILRLLVTALALMLPVSSWAAIAFVSQTNATATSNVSTVTFSQVVSAGTDRALVVCSGARSSGTTVKAITGITFNGSEAFTKIRADTENDNAGGIGTELWRLVAPTVTTANIVVTYASANETTIGVSSTLLTGVSQASPVDSNAGSRGNNSTGISAIITTVADNAAIIDCAYGKGDSGLTMGSGQTSRTNRQLTQAGSGATDGVGVSTVLPKTPAGAETMDWTHASAFDWTISVVSLTPSGGSDPNPTVPSQVTLSWTNGTDPGSPASGIANTTIRRGTGSGCNGATAPAIATVLFPATTYTDTTVQTNTSYCYSSFHTDGVGLVSTSHVTVPITTSGTPPDAPPTIASATFDNDGVTITAGAVAPTKVKIWTFTGSGVVSSVEYTWASLTAGRHDEEWFDGLQGGCVSAIDANGIENTAISAYQCTNFTTQVPRFVDPVDTTPPTLTCPTTIELPAGVTEWTFSCDVNKANTAAKYNTSDTTYDLMANYMALNSLAFSATVSSLTDDSTTTLYVRGATLHPFDVEEDGQSVNYPETSSHTVVIHVAAAPGDVTPPGNVANLAGTLIGNAVTLVWDAAADAVKYQVYQSTDDVTYAPAGTPTAATSTQLALTFGTTYYWKVKALDVVNNLSAAFSNTVTKTTLAAPDIESPSDLEDLAASVFTHSVLLTWTAGTDNSGQVFANIESCIAEVGQTDCANFSALVSLLPQTFLTPINLLPGRRYCFRGKNADGSSNVSLNYSATVCVTTATTGLAAPRIPIPFGTTRLPLATPRLPLAIPRIPVQ